MAFLRLRAAVHFPRTGSLLFVKTATLNALKPRGGFLSMPLVLLKARQQKEKGGTPKGWYFLKSRPMMLLLCRPWVEVLMTTGLCFNSLEVGL